MENMEFVKKIKWILWGPKCDVYMFHNLDLDI